MYLHIGNGKTIKKDHIIGIFDMDTATMAKSTKGILRDMEKKGSVSYTDSDIPRSFVLYKEDSHIYKIQLSRISTAGLHGRAVKHNTDSSEL